ncbi:MAG: GxxExxY protein [Gemmatimonas sp.]|nr:GxxExxY protein [Gemmatimonas sp.]
MGTDELTSQIIGAAMDVHSAIGPGLLEAAYEVCLEREIESLGLRAVRQVPLAVTYRGVRIDIGYRIDLLVEEDVVVEVKALAAVRPVHKAQLLSYLRLGGYDRGLLLNFHVEHMRDGISRVTNGWNAADEEG